MSKIIVLDPGHGQFSNRYPAATAYYEGTQMYKLAYLLKPLLEANGFKVVVTRTSITANPELATRGKVAGSNKADLFISLHSNAVSSAVTDSVYGVDVYYSLTDSNTNKSFADKLGKAVSQVMSTTWRGSHTRAYPNQPNWDYYGVLRASAQSGCKRAFLIEHGFHTAHKDANFLIVDSNLKKIAEKECEVICDWFGVSTSNTTDTTVQTGVSNSACLVKVITDTLNVRKGPGENYDVVTSVKKNQIYTIIATSGTWGKLKSGVGYINISSEFVSVVSGKLPESASDTQTSVPSTFSAYTVKIVTDSLNVRKGAGINYPVVTEVKRNQIYTIVDEVKNGSVTWGKLKSGVGYIALTGYTQKTSGQSVSATTSSKSIRGTTVVSVDKMTAFIQKNNASFDKRIAQAFYDISKIYGIRGDVAICQSIHETGWFTFKGSVVKVTDNNFAGLGATNSGGKPASFKDIEAGVRAQMQHLYAYSCKDAIPAGETIVDTRFSLVTRGVADEWTDLNGRWAVPGTTYGQQILAMYEQLKNS